MDIYGIRLKNTILSDFGVPSPQKQFNSASEAPQGLFSTTLTQETTTTETLTTQRHTFNELDFSLASRAMYEEASNTSTSQNMPIKEDPSDVEAGIQSQELPEFNVSFLEKLKSGMSFQDALLATKKERYAYYFNEALKSNGGDVEGALRQAEAQLKGETSLSDEELYAIVEDIAKSYNQAAAQTGSAEMQRIAEALNNFLEELENKINLDNVPQLKKSGNTTSTGTVDGDEEAELKAQFVQDLMNESSLSSKDTPLKASESTHTSMTEKEKRERDIAIKQYQKMSNFELY